MSRSGDRRDAPRCRVGHRLRHAATVEDGNAIVEFVFVAIVIMVPLAYLIAAVATVQRAQTAVAEAARDAGRAFATSDTAEQAGERVPAAVRLALADQDLPDDATVRFVAYGGSCDGPALIPTLAAGSEFTVCVSRQVQLPAVPSAVAGRGIRTVGVYVVHVDDFRTVGTR